MSTERVAEEEQAGLPNAWGIWELWDQVLGHGLPDFSLIKTVSISIISAWASVSLFGT